MFIKLLLLTICKFCNGVLQNGSLKHLIFTWANFLFTDFYSTNIGVTPDISINLSPIGS